MYIQNRNVAAALCAARDMLEEVFENPQVVEPKTINWPKIVLAVVLGFGLLATAAYAGYWYGTQSTVSDKQYEDKISTPSRTQPKNECTKIVSVTEEYPSRYFVACSNTVFIIDEGKITERWSIDQLGSAEITSMIKVGNALYVGNEGVTLIDLNTKELKRYARDNDKEMRHVGNTLLAADGDIVWVVTSGDLYKITISTGNLQRVTEEAPPSRSFDGVIATEKSVIILTAGGIFRYDKAVGAWEIFDKSIFGAHPGVLSESIYSHLVAISNTIVLLQPYIGQNQPHHYQLWYAPDVYNTKWQVLTEFTNQVEGDYPEVQGYHPTIEIVGYEEDTGSVVLRVGQYGDITYYYVTPTTGEVGLARKKYHDDYIQIDPEERYRDFINNVLESRINNP